LLTQSPDFVEKYYFYSSTTDDFEGFTYVMPYW